MSKHGTEGGSPDTAKPRVGIHLTAPVLVLLAVGTMPGLAPAGSPSQGQPRAAAVIAALEGDVRIHRSDDVRRGFIGQRLSQGDEIRVGEDGAAMIYFSGGHVVRVPAGNRLEIVQDPGTDVPGRVARMSARTVEAVEAGLWVMSDPAGRMLLTAMRGSKGARSLARDVTISPRRETVLEPRPLFHWISTHDVHVVVTRGGREIWTSSERLSSPFRYPATAPRLVPGAEYAWWIAHGETRGPLTGPMTFRVATAERVQDAALLEAELSELERSQGESLTGFLRCAYLVGIEAWSAAVASAGTLRANDSDAEAARHVIALAARGMGLTDRIDDLVDILRPSEDGVDDSR